jgi:hypothetical protein
MSIKDTVQTDGRVWYLVEGEECVLASDVLWASPYTSCGVTANGADRSRLAPVVAERLNVRVGPGVLAVSAAL